MPDTSIHYLTYDPEAMWEDMMIQYVAAGGDILYPGDEKEILLRSVQAMLMQAYAAFDTAARMRTLRYAVGEYLDLIGETRGVVRIAGTKAQAGIDVTIQNASSVYTLAAGTLFTFDGTRYYQVMESVTGLTSGAPVVIHATLECTEIGTVGNGLPSGTVMTNVEGDPHILTAVLTEDAADGVDEEEDDEYRERIRTSAVINTTGPREAYRAKAQEVSALIRDANAVTLADATVVIVLLFQPDTSEGDKTTIFASVLENLDTDDTRPLTDKLQTAEAEIVPYLLDVTYMIPATATGDVSTAITQAVADYQEYQEGTIGLAFDPYKLLSLMYTAGAVRVEFGVTSNIDGNPIEYTAIDADQALEGTITLTLTT